MGKQATLKKTTLKKASLSGDITTVLRRAGWPCAMAEAPWLPAILSEGGQRQTIF
jgi:hypothetical protein